MNEKVFDQRLQGLKSSSLHARSLAVTKIPIFSEKLVGFKNSKADFSAEVRQIHGSDAWFDSNEDRSKSGSEALDSPGASDHPENLQMPAAELAAGAAASSESVGSTEHLQGMCKPCVFYTSKWGCKLASRCGYCHLPHATKNLPGNIRPQRRERAATKDRILEVFKTFQRELQQEVKDNHYMRKEVVHFLNPGVLCRKILLFDFSDFSCLLRVGISCVKTKRLSSS